MSPKKGQLSDLKSLLNHTYDDIAIPRVINNIDCSQLQRCASQGIHECVVHCSLRGDDVCGRVKLNVAIYWSALLSSLVAVRTYVAPSGRIMLRTTRSYSTPSASLGPSRNGTFRT